MTEQKDLFGESRRLALQRRLDPQKSQSERNALGQFATPGLLASEIVSHAVGLLPCNEPIRFLDPGFGTGCFYSALRNAVRSTRIKSAVGFEIDEHYGVPSHELWARTPLKLRLEDFTKAAPPQCDRDCFNLLICNPPYVRHHHIFNGEKGRLQDAAEAACGVRISGLAGLYCYFLGLSHAWMASGGIAAWLIPSEFMNVNYGRAVQSYLLTQVTLLHIHRFDPNDVQFGDALVSSAVVVFRKERPPQGHDVEFSFGGSLAKPTLSAKVPGDFLAREHKWTRFPFAEIRERRRGITLGDLFRIKRGIATGDNKFFILSPQQIEEHNLPRELFRPILPSPRYLPADRIEADPAGNPLLERRLFLLDCRLPETEVEARYPALWKYLLTGRHEVSDRYLCRHRKPWYSQEDRPPTPFVCTYLGRSDNRDKKPFRFILNNSQATAANVYLLLYPRPFLANAVREHPRLLETIWRFLHDVDAADLLGEGRVYGGGLHKLEPNELANIPADELVKRAKLAITPAV